MYRAASIEQFKGKLKGGGIRPSMFAIDIIPPRQLINDWNTEKLSFLCKAATVPSAIITPVSVGLPAGGALKLPGSKVFEPWSITCISDDTQKIRKDFEIWSEIIIGNEDQMSDTNLMMYMGSAQVFQLDRDATVLQTHKLEFLYPTNIDAMNLSYEAEGQVQEFGITMAYHYHTSSTTQGVRLSQYLDLIGSLF